MNNATRESMLRAIPTDGRLVPVRELRSALGMDRETFDATLLALADDGTVSLHKSDYIRGHTPDELHGMLHDYYHGEHVYYIGAARRA